MPLAVIIVPFSIRNRELGGVVSADAQKIFAKVKASPELAVTITAKGLPKRTTLHKVYATTADGARRLLFFCRHAPPPEIAAQGKKSSQKPPLLAPPAPERWVLLFYRAKGDVVGDNMSPRNRAYEVQLEKNLIAALADLQADTKENPHVERF